MFLPKLACPRHFRPEHGNFAKISELRRFHSKALEIWQVSDIFNRRWQIWDVLGKIACLDVFGQKCPGGVREVSGRCPGGVREASGRRPGGVREASGRRPGGVRDVSGGGVNGKNSKNLAEQPQKWLFQKKKTERQKKNGFLRFGAPIKCQNAKNRIFGLPSTQKKTQKHKKTWICVFALQKCPKTPENWIFPCICPDTPKKRFLHFHDKKNTRSNPKMEFSRSCTSRATKRKKNLTLSLQTSRNTKTWILMLSPRLQPHKTPNRKNYKSLVEQLQTWLRKNQKDKRKTDFCLFCAPKTPETLLVSETRKETGFCGFALQTCQETPKNLEFFLLSPRHTPNIFGTFTIKRKSTRSIPIVS